MEAAMSAISSTVKTQSTKPDTKFLDDLSYEIWFSTYKDHLDKDVNDSQFRVAAALASVENDKEFWTKEFARILENFRFVPGGRINSNAGTGLKGTTFLNCFVDGFVGVNQDSMTGIMNALHRQALILKSEGGYGFCADVMRPRGAFIAGVGVEGPGAVKMLEMWDKQSEVITAGSGEKKKAKTGKNKIRKGAMMVTMSDWHPSIEEFITAKQTQGRLTKFNMSVLISDDFMKAVENHLPWSLEFPETDYKMYDTEWNGNLREWKSKGYPVKVWKTFDDASTLWDLIMSSTYNRNEPGVLFIDTINRLNSLYYCENISSTNPCGEQILPVGGVCLLGSLNLTQYVDLEKQDWDYKKLQEDIPTVVRMLDNVNDITYTPLESQKQNLKDKRRIGLGYMGYGSALFMLKVRYGSDKALALTDRLGEFVINEAYKASSDLAKEKGSFLLYDEEKYSQGEFFKTLLPETKGKILKQGLRNSHLGSIQPTGNSSIYANNVSGGLEPVFLPEYIRTAIQSHPPDGMVTPIVDWGNKLITQGEGWAWAKEGDEPILVQKFNGDVYKFDQSRGLLKESKVKDYAVRVLEKTKEWDANAEWASDTSKLTIDDHVKTMKVFAKYIDSAMSKCVVEGTLLSTSKGIVPIESMSDFKYQESDTFSDTNNDYLVLDENGQEKKVTKHYFGGEKDSFSLRFDNGFELSAAWTHRLKTEDGYKRVEDLQVGDKVFYRTGEVGGNLEMQKLPFPDFTNCIKRKFPEVIDSDFATFLGMWFADGHTTDHSVGICEKDDAVGEKLDVLFEKLFGVKPTVQVDKRNGVRMRLLNSTPIANIFDSVFGKRAAGKKIPKEILCSPKDIQVSFLNGLTLDGYLHDGQLTIYDGYSEQIATSVSYMLSNLGINFLLRKKRVPEGVTSEYSYGVIAYMDSTILTPIEHHKRAYKTCAKQQMPIIVPKEIREQVLAGEFSIPDGKEWYFKRNAINSLRDKSYLRKESAKEMGLKLDYNLSFVTITKKTFLGKRRVFDIEVEDTHSYLINGIVSHNTVNLPSTYAYEDFKRLYMDVYKSGTVKGCTTYRDGTMTSVLSAESTSKSTPEKQGIIHNQAPKRPERLPCHVHHVTADGIKWVVLVGLHTPGIEGKVEEELFTMDLETLDPYEVFSLRYDKMKVSPKVDRAVIIKNGVYSLEFDDGSVIKNITKFCEAGEQNAMSRVISLGLRHGANIKYVVAQLLKGEGTIVSFSKSIARTLKKYVKMSDTDLKCPECSGGQLEMSEGCYKCRDCGHSKCQ